MRDVRGLGLASIVLAAYEAYALTRKRPTITDLSHRWPWSAFVIGWWGLLGYHFYVNGRRHDDHRD